MHFQQRAVRTRALSQPSPPVISLPFPVRRGRPPTQPTPPIRPGPQAAYMLGASARVIARLGAGHVVLLVGAVQGGSLALLSVAASAPLPVLALLYAINGCCNASSLVVAIAATNEHGARHPARKGAIQVIVLFSVARPAGAPKRTPPVETPTAHCRRPVLVPPPRNNACGHGVAVLGLTHPPPGAAPEWHPPSPPFPCYPPQPSPCPAPSTLQGVATSLESVAKAAGPVLGASLFAMALDAGGARVFFNALALTLALSYGAVGAALLHSSLYAGRRVAAQRQAAAEPPLDSVG